MFGGLRNISESVSPITANLPGGGSISGLLNIGLNVVIGICWALAFVSLAYSCYLYIMSRGEPKALSQAWNAGLYAVWAMGISFIVITAKIIAPRLLGLDDATVTQYESQF